MLLEKLVRCLALPAGVVQGTELLRCLLETGHDAVGGGFWFVVLWRCAVFHFPFHIPGLGLRAQEPNA